MMMMMMMVGKENGEKKGIKLDFKCVVDSRLGCKSNRL